MTPRATNLAILLLLLLELGTGFGSYLVGSPSGRWVFWLHSAGALALVVLLLWKWRIVVRSFLRRGAGLWALPPALLGLLFLGSLATGLLWSTVGLPRVAVPGFGSRPGLGVHVWLSTILVPFFLLHVVLRWTAPRASDFLGRRAALRWIGLVGGGVLLWRGLEAFTAVASLPGARRRFTGSHEEGSFSGNRFPRTNWLFDTTQRIDPEKYRLSVYGEVDRPVELTLAALERLGAATHRATLDCTGGWYTTQDWTGVPVSAVLSRAGLRSGARSLVFRSITGYDRRFSVGDADELLLATRVGGETLSRGHGFPVRLVAPNRRGFAWVKWVREIEVSRASPLLQPPLPLE